jgi:1-acyl-sn-glycerol-3-phosphate acyltransferase
MPKLRATVVGTLSFIALVGNILFWLWPLLAVALVKAMVPWPPLVERCRRAANWIATNWIGFNIWGLKTGGRLRWEVSEPGHLDPDGWYLVTSNHLSAVDIVILQWLFHRRIPMLKFFLKRQLFWVPGLGVAWWALEFPFMHRYSRATLEQRPELRRRDIETTRRACQRFRQVPTTVINFLEGTRFTPEKRDRRHSPYRHLLQPRAGGIAQVVSSLDDRLNAWLDVTITYPGGIPGFWDLISGQIPVVRVQVEEVPIAASWKDRDYLNDQAFREQFQAFVNELWARKDARLGQLQQSESPRVRTSESR